MIVGPENDPARIKGGHDAVAAFKAIATANAPFVSRGDNCGTDALELRLWKNTRVDKARKLVSRHRRGHGPGAECRVRDAGLYPLRPRHLAQFCQQSPLVIAVEGDPKLLNRYDVIQLNREKHGKERLEERRGSPSGWLRQRASRRSAPMKSMASSSFTYRLQLQSEGFTGGAQRAVQILKPSAVSASRVAGSSSTARKRPTAGRASRALGTMKS